MYQRAYSGGTLLSKETEFKANLKVLMTDKRIKCMRKYMARFVLAGPCSHTQTIRNHTRTHMYNMAMR